MTRVPHPPADPEVPSSTPSAPRPPAVARIRDLCNEAAAHAATGAVATGLVLAQEAWDLARQELPGNHYALAHVLVAIGWLRLELGETAAAKEGFAAATVAARVAAASDPDQALVALLQSERFHRLLGEAAAADGLRQEIIALTAEVWGHDHPRYFAALSSLRAERPGD